jgi:hypothetical protein
MNPLNQEHKEAEQAIIDKKRNDFIASLPEEDKKKFQAIEKAVAILVEADVLFYLFPSLPLTQDGSKEGVWQWNSVSVHSKTKWGEDGKMSDASMQVNDMFHKKLFVKIFDSFHVFFKGTTFEEKLADLPYFFHACHLKVREYLGNK